MFIIIDAIFAFFHAITGLGYDKSLLESSRFQDNTNANSEEHPMSIEYVLELHRNSMLKVRERIGENINLYRSISSKTGISVIECSSHYLNLAVKDILASDEGIFHKVNCLIVKSRNLTKNALLRISTDVHPSLLNVTRCSYYCDLFIR